jgi:hypothetical protein
MHYILKDDDPYPLPTSDHDNIFYLNDVKQFMEVTSTAAQKIVDDILSTDDEILGISIINKKGNILAANSKESFRKAFGVTVDGDKYGATLAVGILSLVNEVKDMFGEAQAIISIHKNCKLMLLPIPSYEILVGLVLQRDYNIANKIEKLLADTVESH